MQVLSPPVLPKNGEEASAYTGIAASLYLRVLKLRRVSYTMTFQVEDEPVLRALHLPHHHLLSWAASS